MTLPVLPDPETILANSAAVLRDVVLPAVTEEWPRSCVRIIASALEYAAGLLDGERAGTNVAELAAALARLRVERPVTAALAGTGSVHEQASALLVWAQHHPGDDADAIRAGLHPVLVEQLDREAAAVASLLTALHVAMRGKDE